MKKTWVDIHPGHSAISVLVTESDSDRGFLTNDKNTIPDRRFFDQLEHWQVELAKARHG